MSEMVERVTAALTLIAGKTYGCDSDRCCCSGAEAFECKSGLAIEELAIAAIEAMREPSNSMIRAGGETGYFSDRCISEAEILSSYQGSADVWRAMIEAALK